MSSQSFEFIDVFRKLSAWWIPCQEVWLHTGEYTQAETTGMKLNRKDVMVLVKKKKKNRYEFCQTSFLKKNKVSIVYNANKKQSDVIDWKQ